MLCVTTERLPLRRPRGRRRRSIVRRGLSAHLGMPVGVIRLVMVLLVPVGFTGPLLYVWFWVTVPAGDPVQAAMDQRPAALSRLAPRLRDPARKLPLTDIGVGLVLVIGASVLIAARNGADITRTWLLPALIMLAGTALAWSQLDAIQRDRVRTHTGGRTPVSVLRLVGGMVLVGLGIFLLVGRTIPLDDLLRSAIAALAVLIGAALVLAPWWLRLVRELGDERAARARESERADVAVVGDAVPDAGTEALLQATREALVNAVTHGRAPYSLYLEVVEDQVEVFVRDHGDGFELSTVPTDRFGVRESIIGRVVRRGGTATVQSRPGRGTEVHLCLPRVSEGER